jgi:hypothetical protein
MSTFLRKVRYLKYRGTLFHRTPRVIRQKLWLKKRRSWRRAFFFLRPGVLSRLRRLENAKSTKVLAGPLGYESFAGHKIVPLPEPARLKRSLSIRERSYRFVRKFRYVINKRKLYRHQLHITRKQNTRRVFRIMVYLVRTGKLFKVDWVAVRAFLDRNYSFLGKSKYFVILINSTTLYLFAYLFIYLSKAVSTALVANTYHIKTIVMYYDVNFLIRSGDWSPDMIQVVFSAGPFVAFFLCLISVVIYANTTYENWSIRLFVFWVMCNSYVQFFGELMLGSLLSKGFGWTIAYLFYLDTPKMVIALLGFIALVSAGLGLAKFALYSGNIYFNKIDKNNRMPLVISQIFLPFVIGTILMIILKQPRINTLELTVSISMILVILPATIRARFIGNMYFDEDPKRIRLMWPWLLALLILLPAFRYFFGIGVRI